MPSNSNSVPFRLYGVVQIVFVSILFFNFILSVSFILTKDENSSEDTKSPCEGNKNSSNANNSCERSKSESKSASQHHDGLQAKDLILPSLIASAVLLLMSFCVLYILTYKARTIDLVGNLQIVRGRTASFKVAFLSWVLTSMETILRLIALCKFKDNTLDYESNAPWDTIVGYHILLLVQTTFQIYCLYIYEKNVRLCREGKDWLITRKSFLILMTLMNGYLWVLNVAKIEVIVDLTSHHMEEFFSGSVERIIYTINRASTLAYHVESAQLLYKFYEEDSEQPLNDQYQNLDHEYPDYGHQIVETESGKGAWLGFFMFGILLFMAIGSFLVRSGIDDVHYTATISTVFVVLTIFCITLKTTLSVDNTDTPDDQNEYNLKILFKDMTSYMAGEDVSHIRVLLFYSICAVSYHFLLAIRVSVKGESIDVFQPAREAFKGIACICLTIFMFWMSHHNRKLRCWMQLNIMFWIVITLLCLELVEETFEHDNTAKDPLQVYALPLAIDFKTYVIIHTFSDLTSAKTEYRRELRTTGTGTSILSRASTPLLGE